MLNRPWRSLASSFSPFYLILSKVSGGNFNFQNVSFYSPCPFSHSGQGRPAGRTEQCDSGQHQQPSGHCDVSCNAQSELTDNSGGQSSIQPPQIHGAAHGTGRHRHGLQRHRQGWSGYHRHHRGLGWPPDQLHHAWGTIMVNYTMLEVPLWSTTPRLRYHYGQLHHAWGSIMINYAMLEVTLW